MLNKRLIYMAFIALTLLLISACKDDPASSSDDDDLVAGMYCVSGGTVYSSGVCGDASSQSGFCDSPTEDFIFGATTQAECEALTIDYCNCVIGGGCYTDDDDHTLNESAATEAECEDLEDHHWDDEYVDDCNEEQISTIEECSAAGGAWTNAPGEWGTIGEMMYGFCFNIEEGGAYTHPGDSDPEGTWDIDGTAFTLQEYSECEDGDGEIANGITTEEDCEALENHHWDEGHNMIGSLSGSGFILIMEGDFDCEFETQPSQADCEAAGGYYDTYDGDTSCEDLSAEECETLGGESVLDDPCIEIQFDPYTF